MVWLLGACVAAGLLYFWLTANWFARLLVFLSLIPVCVLLAGNAGQPPAGTFILLGVLAALSWVVSGIPKFVRFYRDIPAMAAGRSMVAGISQGRDAAY